MIISMLTEGVGQGLLWALLAIGIFITFRILEFADLTAEGSFALGGSVTAAILAGGGSIAQAMVVALFAGAAAGFTTGILHTKLKIPAILAGILTMIALYSVNIRILGNRGSLPIGTVPTLMDKVGAVFGVRHNISPIIAGALLCAVAIAALYWLFGTELGSSIRATGSNEKMCRALGISTDKTKIIALIMSNSIIAVSGSLVAQSHYLGDVTMGTGAIVIGLASLIIGEAFTGRKFPFWARLAFVAVGSIIYRFIVVLIINIELFSSSDLKLITAAVVAVALALPNITGKFKKSAKTAEVQQGAQKPEENCNDRD